MDAPAHAGCLIDVRIIGIINAEQTQEGQVVARPACQSSPNDVSA
jgi:hypothetical protein